MSEHNKIKRDLTISLILGLSMIVAFCLVVTAGALEVMKLPQQPYLTVTEGRSVFYEDGSIDLQPASKQAGSQLQNTINARDLQGN